MARDVRHALDTRNAKGNARAALFDGGRLLLYEEPRPLSADNAVADRPVVVELSFGTPAFGAFFGGTAVSNAFTAARVVTPGRPTWGRAVRADGSVIEDYAAGRNGYAPDGVTPMAGEVYDIATPGGVIEAGTVIDGVSMVLTEPASLG